MDNQTGLVQYDEMQITNDLVFFFLGLAYNQAHNKRLESLLFFRERDECSLVEIIWLQKQLDTLTFERITFKALQRIG